MQRRSTEWMAALAGFSLAMLATSGAETATRSEYCERLGVQLDGTIQAKPDQPAVIEAIALRKKATRLCAEHKQAQGIRALANGLKLLGATPADSGE